MSEANAQPEPSEDFRKWDAMKLVGVLAELMLLQAGEVKITVEVPGKAPVVLTPFVQMGERVMVCLGRFR